MLVPLRRAGGALLAVAALAALPATAAAGNRAPSCLGTTTAVAPGGERSFTLRCQDYDGPQASSLEVVDPPDHGTLSVVQGLRVRFQPAAGYSGDDSFTFRVSDGEDETATLTQQLRVTHANLPPECLALDVQAIQGSAHLADPCVDPNEGDAVRLIVAADPQHGSLDVNHRGSSVSYGAAGYVGPDAFSLQATDGDATGAPTEIDVESVPLEPPVCESRPTLPVRTGREKAIPLVCRDNTPYVNPLFIGLTVVDPPDHGQVDQTYGRIAYTPDPGFTGHDAVTLRPSNGGGHGPPVTVSISVADDADEPPSCSVTDTLRLRTGATISVPASCSDPDGDAVTRAFDPPPAHGRITDDTTHPLGGSVYTADDGYAGQDSYGLRGSDGRSHSLTATQRLRVVGDGENTLPECVPFSARVLNDETTSIGLQCQDAEHDPITFTWTQPEHGSVAKGGGVAPGWSYLVYTPPPGHTGDDRFTYRASDGRGETVPVSVLLEVVAPRPPSCGTPPRRAVRGGGRVTIWLRCFDDRGPRDPTLVDGPAHGTVQAWGDYFEYTPDDGYEGADSFTVRATNAVGSDEAVQHLDVGPDVNTVPSCSPMSNATTREPPLTVQVSCSDPEHDPLTLETVAGPAHGTLGEWDHEQRRVTYTPAAGFSGDDEFTFRALDGRGHSATVTQHVRVLGADDNDVPRCTEFGVHTQPGQAVRVWTSCRDADGDPLTVAIAHPPDHGTASEPNAYGELTYTPAGGFTGTDTFGITASDGRSTSPVATISVQVGSGASAAPRCTTLAANVDGDSSRRIQLTCRGWFDNPVAPQIVEGPQHGSLGAIDGSGWVTYTPHRGFRGTDRFTYRGVHQGVASAPATVELHVSGPLPPADAPPQSEPPPATDPPPATEQQPDPPPPPDPLRRAAEERLGAGAVPAPGLQLGSARAFVPAAAAGGAVTVDAASEKLLAVVCPSSCEVIAGQRIALGGARPIRLRTQRLRLGAGRAGVVVLRLTKAQRRRVRRARRATLTLTLAVTPAGGRAVRDTARFRIRAT